MALIPSTPVAYDAVSMWKLLDFEGLCAIEVPPVGTKGNYGGIVIRKYLFDDFFEAWHYHTS